MTELPSHAAASKGWCCASGAGAGRSGGSSGAGAGEGTVTFPVMRRWVTVHSSMTMGRGSSPARAGAVLLNSPAASVPTAMAVTVRRIEGVPSVWISVCETVTADGSKMRVWSVSRRDREAGSR